MSLFRKQEVELPDDLVVKVDFTDNDNDQQKLVQNQVKSLEQIQTEAKETICCDKYISCHAYWNGPMSRCPQVQHR